MKKARNLMNYRTNITLTDQIVCSQERKARRLSYPEITEIIVLEYIFHFQLEDNWFSD